MKINIIAAIGKNNEIGLNNKLLWKSKSDLEHFKQLTLGKPIIMGRKTFDSLPGILPDRQHIVVTSYFEEECISEGIIYVRSLEAALRVSSAFLRDIDEIFIIGGASIYKQAIPLADELHISHMNWEGAADTFFPEIGPEWIVQVHLKHEAPLDGSDPLTWVYNKYTRKK